MKKIIFCWLSVALLTCMLLGCSSAGGNAGETENKDAGVSAPYVAADTAEAGEEAAEEAEAGDELVLTQDTVYATGSVNLRTGPSVDSDVVAQIGAGTELSRDGTVGKWSQVTYEGETVYVSSNLVETREAYTVEPADGSLTVNAEKANIRVGAGRTYAILGTATTGDTFTLTGRTDTEWYEILFEGQTAYIHRSLAELNEE